MATLFENKPQIIFLNKLSVFLFGLAFLSFMFFFSTAPKLIAPVVCVLILCVLLTRIRYLNKKDFDETIFYVFSFVLIFASISILLFNNLDQSMKQMAKAFILVSPFILLSNIHNRIGLTLSGFLSILPVLYCLSLVLLLIQLYTNISLKYFVGLSLERASARDFNDFVVANTMFFWFVMANRRNNFLPWINYINLLLLLLIVIFSSSESAKLSLLLSSITFFLFFVFQHRIKAIIRLGVLLSLLAIFLVPGHIIRLGSNSAVASTIEQYFGESALHRIDIWQRCHELILEKPLLGWGSSANTDLPKAYQATFFNETMGNDLFAHPHNAFFQIQLELGIIGLLFFLFLLNKSLNSIASLHRSIHPYIYTSFVSIIAVWLVGASLWRSWWLVFIAMLYLCVRLLSSEYSQKE